MTQVCSPKKNATAKRPSATVSDGLDPVRGGQKTLKRGVRGLDVAAAQKALNRDGAGLKTDGRFGSKTDVAVRAYQKKHGLKVDGMIGPETMGAFDGKKARAPTANARRPADVQAQRGSRQAARQAEGQRQQTINPANSRATSAAKGAPPASASEAQKYDHYQNLVTDRGGKFRTAPGQKNIVGLRTETNYKQNRAGKYDDKVVMLWKDQNGNKRVREYRGNMDPAGRNEGRFGSDVNRDGRKDLGRVSEGYHEYKMGLHNGRARRYGSRSLKSKALRPTRAMKVDRDVNHDGKISAGERKNSTASDMLFHMGGNNGTSSAGCQTMAPAEYARFWRDLTRDGRPGTIGYTVVNAG